MPEEETAPTTFLGRARKSLGPVGDPYSLAILATIITLATAFFSITYLVFGVRSPRLLASGIVAVTLGVFLLTLLVFYDRKNKERILEKGVIRTALTISFTVAYLILLSYSLTAHELGLQYDNPFMENFYIVYITIIAFYFGTTSLEILKQKK